MSSTLTCPIPWMPTPIALAGQAVPSRRGKRLPSLRLRMSRWYGILSGCWGGKLSDGDCLISITPVRRPRCSYPNANIMPRGRKLLIMVRATTTVTAPVPPADPARGDQARLATRPIAPAIEAKAERSYTGRRGEDTEIHREKTSCFKPLCLLCESLCSSSPLLTVRQAPCYTAAHN